MYIECSPLAMPIYVNLGFAKVISVWTTKHSFFFCNNTQCKTVAFRGHDWTYIFVH